MSSDQRLIDLVTEAIRDIRRDQRDRQEAIDSLKRRYEESAAGIAALRRTVPRSKS